MDAHRMVTTWTILGGRGCVPYPKGQVHVFLWSSTLTQLRMTAYYSTKLNYIPQDKWHKNTCGSVRSNCSQSVCKWVSMHVPITQWVVLWYLVGKEHGLYILFNFSDWPFVISLCDSACSMVFSLPQRGIMSKVRMASNWLLITQKMFIYTSFSNNKAGDKHNTSFPHEWNQNT